ncbi:MAG: hypothetical protein DRQ89_13010 [Epsilonproteobacteria bacterium]|nr:MAG: hypothetical protein DRQ89_13010 [Campylobacterota bacterium]
MTEKVCKPGECLPKEYDGMYRCMVCFKPFVQAEEEDVMNQLQVAPAIARIAELETENTTLKQKLEALKAIVSAVRNKEPVEGYPAAMLDMEDRHGYS